eukprot:4887588-Prymnesium_polylepis.2
MHPTTLINKRRPPRTQEKVHAAWTRCDRGRRARVRGAVVITSPAITVVVERQRSASLSTGGNPISRAAPTADSIPAAAPAVPTVAICRALWAS